MNLAQQKIQRLRELDRARAAKKKKRQDFENAKRFVESGLHAAATPTMSRTPPPPGMPSPHSTWADAKPKSGLTWPMVFLIAVVIIFGPGFIFASWILGLLFSNGS